MTHPRKIIRTSVADAIRAAATAADDRVWAGEQPPVDVDAVLIEEGPVILVYTRRDRVDDRDYPATGTGSTKRRLDLCVEILATGNFAVEDKIDDLAEVVETLLDGFTVPGQPATEIRLAETNVMISDVGERTLAGAFLMYDACYWKAWRADPDDEAEFFPEDVFASIKGDAPEVVATCADCPDGECP